MSSAAKCLADAVADGRLTREQADAAEARVKELMEGADVPESEAMLRAAEGIALAAQLKQRHTALHLQAVARVEAQARAHPKGYTAGAAAVFGRDVFQRSTGPNVEGRTRSIRGEAHARLAALLDAFRSTHLGLKRDIPATVDFVRALYGEGQGQAQQFAKAWTDTTRWMVQRFNRGGGQLPAREDWRIPQVWDRDAVRAAGQAAWISDMKARVEAGELRLADFETGAPLPAERMDDLLAQTYARISTDGLVDLTPGQPMGRPALANKHNAPRAFEWTSADAWLRFNRDYGVGDAGIFDLIVGHINSRARDTAMIEILGPNANHTARFLIDRARQVAEGDGTYGIHKLEAVWDQVSGAASSPVNEWVANFGRGVRAWLTSAQLGSATLSAVTDFATIKMTSSWNGISAVSVMSRYLGMLKPGAAEDRQLAVRLGLIADGWAQRAAGASRDQAEIVGNDLPGRAADFVLRASGLQAHTQAAKWAFGMEMLGHLADQAGKPLDQLDAPLRAAFGRYGISAEQWDIIRTRGVFEEDGARFLYPEQIVRRAEEDAAAPPAGGEGWAQRAEDLGQDVAPPIDPDVIVRQHQQAASRLLEMVQTETGFAVVEPGAVERAITLGRSRPGTAGGELLRSMMQYKSFAVSMMSRHLMRGLQGYRAGDHGRYTAALGVSLTVMGMAALQLKELAKGRDPRDMTDWRSWGAAFLQGGGAGIMGDFLSSGINRAETGFGAALIGGPVIGLANDAGRLAFGNVLQWYEGKDARFGTELVRFVQRNTPGTSLWYARQGLDALVWNRLQELAGDDATRRWRRAETKLLRETGQRLWWRPEDIAPSRAPDLTAITGATP